MCVFKDMKLVVQKLITAVKGLDQLLQKLIKQMGCESEVNTYLS